MYKFLIIIIIILLIHILVNKFSKLKKQKKLKKTNPQNLSVNSSPEQNDNLKYKTINNNNLKSENETDFFNNIENNLLQDLMLNN
jgi:FtsZ-interacting cell division protein ZipA